MRDAARTYVPQLSITDSTASCVVPSVLRRRDELGEYFLPLALLLLQHLDALENLHLEPCYIEIPFKGSSVACISSSAARK
jgi:hypothetical protein